jgi:hypothetical protein
MDIKQELREWLMQLDRFDTRDEHRMVTEALSEIEKLEQTIAMNGDRTQSGSRGQ